MKDHYTDHLELLEMWKGEVHSMKEKHGKKKSHGKKGKNEKPEEVGIEPSVFDHDVDGLRIEHEPTGTDMTVVHSDPEDPNVVLSDPVGRKMKMTKANIRSVMKLG